MEKGRRGRRNRIWIDEVKTIATGARGIKWQEAKTIAKEKNCRKCTYKIEKNQLNSQLASYPKIKNLKIK